MFFSSMLDLINEFKRYYFAEKLYKDRIKELAQYQYHVYKNENEVKEKKDV